MKLPARRESRRGRCATMRCRACWHQGAMTWGYRVYGSADIEVAKGVQALIAAGFSTNEIAQIAPCLSWDGGVSTLCPKSVRALRAKMLRIDETIGTLQAARDAIEKVVGDADDSEAQG